jgi:hypothetical protein
MQVVLPYISLLLDVIAASSDIPVAAASAATESTADSSSASESASGDEDSDTAKPKRAGWKNDLAAARRKAKSASAAASKAPVAPTAVQPSKGVRQSDVRSLCDALAVLVLATFRIKVCTQMALCCYVC